MVNSANISPWKAGIKNISDIDKFRLSNSKPKLLLYNSNTGTQMIDCSVSFKYEKTSVKLDIFSKTPDEICYWEIIVGERTKESFKWYTKKRTSA